MSPAPLRSRLCTPSIRSQSEGIESPEIFAFVMPENVEVSVVCQDAEISGGGAVPLVFHLLNHIDVGAKDEPERALVRLVA